MTAVFPYNLHTHTTFSDGAHAPEAMVASALEKGFRTLGFSDHGYAPHDTAAMPFEREAAYREAVRALEARYEGRIELPLGYEHDASMPPVDDGLYDYVIESTHFLNVGGAYRAVDDTMELLDETCRMHYGGDWYRLCRDYYESVAETIAHSNAQILGHLDLITKYNEGGRLFDESDPRYLVPALAAADAAVERGMIVEVNTGAMARGWRTHPYPSDALLGHLVRRGAHLTLSSDCHSAAHIDYGFAGVREQLIGLGVRALTTWRGSGFDEAAL